MFGNGNKKNEESKSVKKTASAPTNALNSLVQGTTLVGEIKSESDIRVDGTIKGTLHCKAKVIIGPTGYIEGEVHCKNAIIEGRMEGSLHVAELLNVRETADVNGNIVTNKLIVQSGAIFNVGCKMGTQKSSVSGSKPKSASKVVGSNAERQKDTKKAS